MPTSWGDILLDGRYMSTMKRRNVYKDVQIVFQDPDSLLHPRKTIAHTAGEPVRGLLGGTNRAIDERVMRSLVAVGLSEEQACHRIPKQLSGGQRQRVAIARAIAPAPELHDPRAHQRAGRLGPGADTPALDRAPRTSSGSPDADHDKTSPSPSTSRMWSR